MTIGFSDTFANAHHCHCNRSALSPIPSDFLLLLFHEANACLILIPFVSTILQWRWLSQQTQHYESASEQGGVCWCVDFDYVVALYSSKAKNAIVVISGASFVVTSMSQFSGSSIWTYKSQIKRCVTVWISRLIMLPKGIQSADIGWPTGNGKKLMCSQAQLGQATCLGAA